MMIIHRCHSGIHQDIVKSTIARSSDGDGTESHNDAGGLSEIHVVEAGSMVISIQVLRNVTNNFSEKNVLGRGGFGTVYKGELHDGTKIAVKRMESGVVREKGLAEFKSEIAVLTQFNWNEEGLRPLEWMRRLSIALDVARGVEYLRGLAHQSFLHRDLKPSNILLGNDMRAKVSDIGLVRLAPEGKVYPWTKRKGRKTDVVTLLEEELHSARSAFEQARFNLVTALSNVEVKKKF
ncbi:hypothetical protein K2173_010940 [Erythroxylum novogranatense]|uniref:Protein kinase domain-containing protein n=1 Tax=Erythroxylum novogranatense TaxID=1862640 RepID=A0AAV8T138_9ROSI|nr:hypothetical protein K2173_010940 [Erythroxylum novogranatense]